MVHAWCVRGARVTFPSWRFKSHSGLGEKLSAFPVKIVLFFFECSGMFWGQEHHEGLVWVHADRHQLSLALWGAGDAGLQVT